MKLILLTIVFLLAFALGSMMTHACFVANITAGNNTNLGENMFVTGNVVSNSSGAFIVGDSCRMDISKNGIVLATTDSVIANDDGAFTIRTDLAEEGLGNYTQYNGKIYCTCLSGNCFLENTATQANSESCYGTFTFTTGADYKREMSPAATALILIPIFLSILIFAMSVVLNQEHSILKIALLLLSPWPVIIALNYATILTVKIAPRFGEIISSMGQTAFIIGIIEFVLILYFLILFIISIFKFYAQEKEEKMNY